MIVVAHETAHADRYASPSAKPFLSPPFRPPGPQVAAGGRDKPQASCYRRVSGGRESRGAANGCLQGFLSARPTNRTRGRRGTAHGA